MPLPVAMLAIQAGTQLLTTLLGVFGVGKPDMTKITASNDANAIEAQMALLADTWDQIPHTASNQQKIVDAWYQLWNNLVQMCSDPSLGNAGQNCINDRKRGGKWDWFAMHLDPIINTPLVSEVGVFGAASSNSNLLLIGGLFLIGVIVISSSD